MFFRHIYPQKNFKRENPRGFRDKLHHPYLFSKSEGALSLMILGDADMLHKN